MNSAIIEALAAVSLSCVECSTHYPALEAGHSPRYRCDCGGALDVEIKSSQPKQPYDIFSATESDFTLPAGAEWRQLFDERASRPPIWSMSADELLLDSSGVWRYRELILPAPERYIVSRPEGNTGLYPVGLENCGSGRAGHRQIGIYAGLERLFLKHEGENPTGSIKDRAMTVGVTMAHLLGAQVVACISTGDSAASLASYAAQAGIRSIIFSPASSVVGGKLAQSLAYGATTIQIDGDFADAMPVVEQVCNELGIYLLNSLHPFCIQGLKAIGFEILQQLDWHAPDWVILPAGNPENAFAIGKAFRQAYKLALISHMPRIASISLAGANPFYCSSMQAFSRGGVTTTTAKKLDNPVSHPHPPRVTEESIIEEVSDEELLAAKTVIDRSGIGCESASAATLAGIRKLVARGIIKRDEYVVGVLMGNLLKDTGATSLHNAQQSGNVVVKASIETLKSVLNS